MEEAEMRRTMLPWGLCILIVVGLGLASCGTASQEEAGPTTAATLQATLVTDATAPATHVWEQPTSILEVEETPAETATPSADDKLIARGQRSYEKLECGNCHGEKGEGLPDQGSALAGTELTEAEFKDILRTGGKGELGNEHLYGTSAISESGIGALYLYLQSLADSPAGG
jgi:mono/diheme cytochrome c family protein